MTEEVKQTWVAEFSLEWTEKLHFNIDFPENSILSSPSVFRCLILSEINNQSLMKLVFLDGKRLYR